MEDLKGVGRLSMDALEFWDDTSRQPLLFQSFHEYSIPPLGPLTSETRENVKLELNRPNLGAGNAYFPAIKFGDWNGNRSAMLNKD